MTLAYEMTALLDRLKQRSESGYAAFSASTIPCEECRILGVRMPVLHAISREILKGDWPCFLEASRFHAVYEIRMLHAMVLGRARCDIAQKIALTELFLPAIDNWAICDCLCSCYKPGPQQLQALFPFVCLCAGSDIEFRKRFGLVMLMDYFTDARWSAEVMDIYRHFSHDGYYARMGAAWGLATLFLTHREDVLSILKDGVLDDFTHNKTIQKLRESYRVSDEDKALVRAYRTGGQKR